MKSFTALAITAALACAASVNAYEDSNDYGHDDGQGPIFLRPGMQVENKPPVIVVTTLTRTKTWGAKHTGKPHWKEDKHYHDGHDEDDYPSKKKYGKYGHDNKEYDDDKFDGDNESHGESEKYNDKHLHADSVSDEASAEGEVEAADASVDADAAAADIDASADVDVAADINASGAEAPLLDENIAAAQASSVVVSSTSVVSASSAARTSQLASKISSAVHSASASARASASSAGENLRVGGVFVGAAAGIAAYLLL